MFIWHRYIKQGILLHSSRSDLGYEIFQAAPEARLTASSSFYDKKQQEEQCQIRTSKTRFCFKTCLTYISKAEKISYIPNYFSNIKLLIQNSESMANINVALHPGERKNVPHLWMSYLKILKNLERVHFGLEIYFLG